MFPTHPLTGFSAHHMNRHCRTNVKTVTMDAQRDVKPFSSIAMAGIERCLHGASSRAMALPLGHGGLRGAVGMQPHSQAPACVLNRASSDLSEGGGDRGYHGEELESTSARRPCSAPRIFRNFWSAGDYDAEAGRSTRQPSTSLCRSPFLPSILFVLDNMPITFAPIAGVQNRMCVHPKFLHSNATSHKWPFGGKPLRSFSLLSEFNLKPFCCTAFLHFRCLTAAVAELLDNAVDEVIQQTHCLLARLIIQDWIIDWVLFDETDSNWWCYSNKGGQSHWPPEWITSFTCSRFWLLSHTLILFPLYL